ncbi:unnamed protein product [Effrenium voratum]|nr:unnamed protein product [Effrenium voratum]
MTGPINALRCRICGPYATEGAAAKYRRSCAKLGTNQMYLNMIYRTWGDRLVVASWLPTLLLAAGLGWRQLGPAERALAAAGLYFLAATPTAPSRLRGFLLMLAFDSLYHTRAWVMLLLNCLQLLLSILCFLCGSTFGVPLIFRLGVVTDLVFLVLGYLSFPRAFFGDMRCRSPHKQWLFSTYLKVNWAVPHSAHYIALSFVQSAEDILECRKHCASDTKIIAKIENVEGLRNFDAILQEADGIMVARGDLGMEIPIERIWMAQKFMIKRCKEAGKMAVTATEMLASMEDKPFPTRAEACDVANGVLDGSDMVMLSGEVANGDFPVQTCEMMRRIIEETEHAMD